MPTTTFFNLPAPKREKLLAAARAEFARVPYGEASINQIIRAAGIPRGSFYMYFRDKEELFSFLIREYIHMAEALMVQFMESCGGDPFAALPALYDYVLNTSQTPDWRAAYEDVLRIVTRNGAALIGTFVEQSIPAVLAAAKEHLDAGVLDLRGEEDAEDCISVLLPLTAGAVKDGLLSPDPAAVRRRLVNRLSILARGMAKAD